MKITDLVHGLDPNEKFFSCEFFPPKTSQGVENLIDRAKRLADLGALFVSITWGAGGSHCETSLDLAVRLNNEVKIPTVLHLTCTNMDRAILDKTLQAAAEAGIENILALRGDPPRSDYAHTSDLVNAADLVKYIREHYGDRFCIGVAGYPEGHAVGTAAEQSVAKDLPYLEAKVKAGADFIITQLFYDADKFLEYKKLLRSHPSGLFKTMPIIPGIMPINSFVSFLRSAKLSRASVPDKVIDRLQAVDTKNDEEIKNVGVDIISDLVKQLQNGDVQGAHFYTLNLEKSVSQIIHRTGLSKSNTTNEVLWDDFTNGRYTDPSSAAFGQIDGYGPVVHGGHDGEPLADWGSITSEADVASLFVKHITNEIDVIPFSDEPLSAETGLIQEQLISLNQSGKWTLASQPSANAADSTDRIFGWGPPSGKVYQKAFVEFFIDKKEWATLRTKLDQHPKDFKHFSGAETGPIETNGDPDEKTVVTWGVWNSDDVNATIISKESFDAWREEAFGVLQGWRALYPESSATNKILADASKNKVLVTVIHQDYKAYDDLWDFLLN